MKRRIAIFECGSHYVKIFYESDLREYQVRLYRDGILHPPSDYHTNEKKDAFATADAMLSHETEKISTAAAFDKIATDILDRDATFRRIH